MYLLHLILYNINVAQHTKRCLGEKRDLESPATALFQTTVGFCHHSPGVAAPEGDFQVEMGSHFTCTQKGRAEC